MAILVTGGTGYIGSHTIVELIENGIDAVILDNLVNSSEDVVDRIFEITGVRPRFYLGDLKNIVDIERVFEHEKIDSVIHFAALKAVGESVAKPLEYYENNVTGTINLLNVMKKYDVKKFVFSSSATVYGNPVSNPITEDFALSTTNPYGASKLMIEDILRDLSFAEPEIDVVILRYFNPVGAHSSALIGEAPNGIPNNLMPFIMKVATGELKELSVFGDDYETLDGTGVRDYIHVVDLAKGHVKAVEKLRENPGLLTVNLGTGKGYSVLEIVRAFEKTNGVKIKYKVTNRRLGDIPTSYANSDYAYKILGWKAELGIEEMCESTWKWAKNSKM